MTEYQSLCDFQNLYAAHKKARRGKQGKSELIDFELALGSNLWCLKNELEKKSYHAQPYYTFWVYDPKERKIDALHYADRVVQHSLCDNVLAPILENRLIYDNAACRRGKGTHFALKRLTDLLVDHYKKHGTKEYEQGKTDLEAIKRSLASYRGHLKHGHTYKLRKTVYANFVLKRQPAEHI